jgi:hypothetical protein
MKPTYPYRPIGSIETLSKVLGVTVQELIKLSHNSNNYFFVAKKVKKEDGSIRLTHDVQHDLKRIHEKICHSLLKKVDYPDYIQGSVKGKDYLSNCQAHTNKKIVIKEDISNFFPSITQKVIHEVWAGFFNFPNDVSKVLTELVTLNGALVQGGKTSSFLCNLVLWERESKLVTNLSEKGYQYTRYVDDISVSCARNISKEEQSYIIGKIYGMLKSIGTTPNKKKHKIMSDGTRQELHRVNLNTGNPTLPKKERAKIKAAVFQCEKSYKNSVTSPEYLKQFNSAAGRVNTLNRMHPAIGIKLKKRLLLIKPFSLN